MADTVEEKSLLKAFTNVKVIIGVIVIISSLLTAVWTIDDRYAKNSELSATEGRIISEVRSESASTRVILIEDMESRLDEFDFDISIIERNNEVVPESLRIKRNMLDRRIQRLKNENNSTGSSN